MYVGALQISTNLNFQLQTIASSSSSSASFPLQNTESSCARVDTFVCAQIYHEEAGDSGNAYLAETAHNTEAFLPRQLPAEVPRNSRDPLLGDDSSSNEIIISQDERDHNGEDAENFIAVGLNFLSLQLFELESIESFYASFAKKADLPSE
ncbi:hypothetical protein K3495_g682 [Podosphaera aphanis]|nr:hypothetical protein K3495_g682 [Podosphaera aphanis]